MDEKKSCDGIKAGVEGEGHDGMECGWVVVSNIAWARLYLMRRYSR
jgi:hypothetical protein